MGVARPCVCCESQSHMPDAIPPPHPKNRRSTSVASRTRSSGRSSTTGAKRFVFRSIEQVSNKRAFLMILCAVEDDKNSLLLVLFRADESS